MKPIDVVVAGHICLDIIPRFAEATGEKLDQILTPGKLINVFEAIISTGGPVSNVGLILFKFGGKIEFMANVGNDQFGNTIVNTIKQKTGISGEGFGKVKKEFTSYTIVIAPPNIDRIFLHNSGTNNTFGYNDINFDIVEKAKIFHLGYPPLMRKMYLNDGEELSRIYKKAKELDVTTSLDLSIPDSNSEGGKADWDKILRKTLPYVDIFLPSIEESCYMINKPLYASVRKRTGINDAVDYFSAGDFTAIAGVFLDYGAKMTSLKCGHRGFYLRTQNETVLSKMGCAKPKNMKNWSNREMWSPAYRPDKIASATGSGDAAVAGFLTAFLKGSNIEETIKCANAVGLQNLRAYDAVSGIGTWDEIQKIVRDKNKERNELEIDVPGWEWNDVFKIWLGPNDNNIDKAVMHQKPICGKISPPS